VVAEHARLLGGVVTLASPVRTYAGKFVSWRSAIKEAQHEHHMGAFRVDTGVEALAWIAPRKKEKTMK
jgi:hypothetical protein